MISELLLILVGALMASASSFSLFYIWERKKMVRKIKNTQQIINDEFYMMRTYATDCNEFILELKRNRKGAMSEMVEGVLYDIPRGHEPAQSLIFNQPFMFWNSIASSGSLINLRSRDIVLINDFYKHVESVFVFNKEDYALLKSRLKNAVSDGDETLVRIYCDTHVSQVYVRFYELVEHFERLCESLDWMKSQYSDAELGKTISAHSKQGGDRLFMFPLPEDEDPERKTPI